MLELLRKKHPEGNALSVSAARREANARIAQPPTGVLCVHAVEESFLTDSVAATIN